MNANELAEIIQHLENARYIGASKAAEMLRQQQAEIEALKAGKIRAYDNGVEDGRKPDTNNEPVAWMDYLEHSDVYDLNVSGRGISLYTHPVKELTDEEIANTWDDVRKDATLKSNMKDIQNFARAILRKASEK